MTVLKNNKMHCPVCMMATDAASLSYNYEDMTFTFCSEQCKERFIANPNLYVAQAGKPAARHSVKNIIKQRVLNLDKTIPDDVAKTIYQELMAMMGIKEIHIKENKIDITYNLLEATTQQIESCIEQMGQHLSDNWVVRLKQAFIHYSEETELDNLEQNNGHSCHSPPK